MTRHHRRPEDSKQRRASAIPSPVAPSPPGDGGAPPRAVRRRRGRPRVMIYARTASKCSETEARQLAAARTYAAGLGGEVVGEFLDGGVSGLASAVRPEFERMLEAMRGEGCDLLVVDNVDRLSRDHSALAATLDRLDDMGVDVHDVCGGGPVDPLKASIRALVASMGRERHAARIRIGRARAARERKG